MFKLLQWNCRSSRNKDPYLSLLVNIHRPSVICLQETRLEDHPDPPVLKHYHSYRSYDGHGVAIYIHKTLTQTEVMSRHNSIIIVSDSMSALQAIESGRTDTNEIQGNIINKLNTCRKSLQIKIITQTHTLSLETLQHQITFP